MKHTINGRIVGHKLFTPDKKNPKHEMVKVELSLAPVGDAKCEKNSTATLLVDEKSAHNFPLKGYVRVVVEDTQQVLPLARASAARRKEREAKAELDLQ